MFELEQIRLGLSGAKEKINELEELSADPDFWNDLEKSQKTLQKLKALKNKVGKYEGLVTTYEDILTLIEMGIEEQDDSVYEEVKEMNDSFLAEYEALRIATMLDGEYDRNNAIVTLHAGTGGTEACDWTNMLFRMYSRWAQKEGFEVEVLDMLDGDEAGLKSVTIQVNGENAYGYLKSEKGIHRLVRVSPFDSAGRRPAMLCLKLRMIRKLKSSRMISVLIPTEPAVQAVSTSTRPPLQSVSHTSLRGLWYPVRRREASLPIRIRHSKC